MDFINDWANSQKLAEQYCNRGDLDCRWYHGNWALLKSLGVVSTSGVHASELKALLQRALPEDTLAPGILLSGSTDATLLEILQSACDARGRQPEITAVDICATPLELMGRYAREHGLRFTSTRSDMLDYCPQDGYDLIVTHAFMGNFSEAKRTRLVKKWASLLKEGGSVVTVQRVRPEGSVPLVQFSAEQADNFISASREAAVGAGGLEFADLARIEAAAELFTRHFISYAITSKAALEQLFLDAGLAFQHLEYRALPASPGLAGPSVPSGGEYCFLIASREKSRW